MCSDCGLDPIPKAQSKVEPKTQPKREKPKVAVGTTKQKKYGKKWLVKRKPKVFPIRARSS